MLGYLYFKILFLLFFILVLYLSTHILKEVNSLGPLDKSIRLGESDKENIWEPNREPSHCELKHVSFSNKVYWHWA